MPFNVLLLPLLGGFIFVRYWNRTKYHAIRADKERILLLASAAGIIALGLSFVIKATLGALFPCSDYPTLPCFPVVWYRLIPFPYSAASVLALVLGATMWVPLNGGVLTWLRALAKRETWRETEAIFERIFRKGWEDSEEIDRMLKADGDPLDLLLRLAEKESKTIQATLASGKVYVGFVSSTNPPSSPTRSIGIVPTKSGYRDPVTKEVRYAIHYSDALTRLNQDLDSLLEKFNQVRRSRKPLIRSRKSKQTQLNDLTKSGSVEADDKKKQTSAETVKAREASIKALTEEIEALNAEINLAESRANDLFEEMEKVAEIINDFRLVFPVTEISTISIYREEVKLEYFSQGPISASAPTV